MADLRLLVRYAAMRVKARAAYRVDFALGFAGDVLVAGVGLAALVVVYGHVDTIAGFTFVELLLCWGLAQATLGVFWASFSGLRVFNRAYLVEGGLDRVLLRPLPPYLQVLLDRVEPGALLLALVGTAVFAWGWSAGVPVAPWRLLMFPVFVAGGVLLVAGLLTALASLGFHLHHEGTAVGLASQFSGFAHLPLPLLPRTWAVLVTTVLPFAFTGFLPATFFMDRPEWMPYVWAQPVLGILVFSAGLALWRASLPRYGSTGH